MSDSNNTEEYQRFKSFYARRLEALEEAALGAFKSTELDKLAAAFAKAQVKYGDIKKTKEVNVGSYSYFYAPIEEILKGTVKALSDAGLVVSQLLQTREDGDYITTILMHESGQFLKSDFKLKFDPKGARNINQAEGSAITYSRRYALGSILNVAAEDDDDAIGVNPEGATVSNKKKSQKTAKNGSNSDPKDLEDLKINFGKYKGKTFKDITSDELQNYCEWMEKQEKKGAPAVLFLGNAQKVLSKRKEKSPTNGKVSAKQAKELLEVAHKKGWQLSDITEYMQKTFDKTSSSELSEIQFNQLFQHFKMHEKEPDFAPPIEEDIQFSEEDFERINEEEANR